MSEEESNRTRRSFEVKLEAGPRGERVDNGPEVTFDADTKRDLDDLFRQFDLEQRDAQAASRDYLVT